MAQNETLPLSSDLLTGVEAITQYVYGETTPRKVRRVRNLIDNHGLPVTRKGALISSRRSWIDQYWGAPDRPAGNGEAEGKQ